MKDDDLINRQEWKDNISLIDIQDKYFKLVEYPFEDLYLNMIKYKSEPYSFSKWFTSDPVRLKPCISIIIEFLEKIQEFWNNISEPTWIHIEDSVHSKAVFGGELFPDRSSNIVSSTGIYFDTTVLPDPFLKILPALKTMNEELRCREIIRLSLQVLSYKDIILNDFTPPLAIILPDKSRLDEGYINFINSTSLSDTIKQTNLLFDINIDNKNEFKEFMASFKNSKELVNNIKNKSKLVFDPDWKFPLNEQIDKYLEIEASKLGITKFGDAIFMHIFGRFAQANDTFQRSLEIGATPVIRAERSWIWYKEMLSLSSTYSDKDLLDLHITRSFNDTLKKEIPWINNIPLDSLIEMRKNGSLDEIKYLLSNGISDLINSNPTNFHRTGDKVFDNLNKAFISHEKKIKEIKSKKWKFAGKEISSFIAIGGIELTAAITGNPLYGGLATTANLTGVFPTLNDLNQKYKEIVNMEKNVENTGVGILFKNKK